METGMSRKNQISGQEWNLKELAKYLGIYFLHKETVFY